jgi:hypothetical protein
MDNKSTTKNQGFHAGVPSADDEQDPRKAQPDETDPSIDIDIDDRDEGDDETDARQAGGQRQSGDQKVSPGSHQGSSDPRK